MQKQNNNSAACGVVEIIEARQVHVSGIAQCHIKSFQGRFMTEMGYNWICALYRFFIKHRRSICLVAVDAKGKVIGLAVGGNPHIREEFLKSALFRYPHLLFWKFISKRRVRQVLLRELARRLRRKRAAVRSGYNKTSNTEVRSGNLLSLCVLPGCEGAGVGGKLIESFTLACRAEGYKRLTLSALKQNSRAIAFYKKRGWWQSDIFGKSIIFVLDL